MFTLHERLAADTYTVGQLDLCQILLMNDTQYPWLIMVPMREDIVEVSDLNEDEQIQLWREVKTVSKALQDKTSADKMNIATLGNMVPQLHVHVIARFKTDAAWPTPVWGAHPAKAYEEKDIEAKLTELRQLLNLK